MEIIDTHCHLDVAAFNPDRKAVLERARSGGVAGIVVPGIEARGWDELSAVCATGPDLFPAFGLHPVFTATHSDADLPLLEARLAAQRPVAVGEIGLDFYIKGADRARQQLLFEAQLVMARDAGLPVILHVRKAHDQVLATLKRIRVPGGTAHAFNGSLQQARHYIELGFKLGFGGMLTYERSVKLRGLAQALPAEAIVLETDAPDMVVAQHRGERNSPEYLPDCLLALAKVRDEPLATVAARTTANAREVFGITCGSSM
ncbi:MAG: TatD family hydrolase [Gammaproteobacteria bacterium]|nr:TatD family hydrolase [Gammaproteobacteria bacterium]